MTLDDLLGLGPFALHDLLRKGHAIDPTLLDDREFHGVALGNPRFVELLTWQTFKKVFKREDDGSLRGWNVAVHQDGPFGTYRDRERRGRRVTYGHYGVVPAAGYRMPADYRHALLIDYGLREKGACNPQRRVRDPLVALNAGGVDLLLGYSWFDAGLVQVPTPTFFALTPGGPLAYAVPAP